METTQNPARPAPEATLATRASDDDRRRVQVQLDRHLADGRLTLPEYEDRLGETWSARTLADLQPVLRELPALPLDPGTGAVADPAAGVRREVATAILGWVALAVLFLTIWAVTGAGYFWPVWPIMGTGMGTLGRVAAIRQAAAGPGTRP